MKTINQIKEKLNASGIDVYDYKEQGKLCGYELNTYTQGGVNQIVFIDFRNTGLKPSKANDFIKLFNERVNSIDIDEEIEMLRQDKTYCAAFTVSKGIKDLKQWKENLQNIFNANPEKSVEQKIEALKKKVAKQTEKLKSEIQEICDKLEYQDSSRFSYNIDRLEAFNSLLQEFNIWSK